MRNFSLPLITAVLGLCTVFSAYSFATLSPAQQAAKERGIMLYNQYKPAENELRIAAEAGDAEAQFYLGENLRHKNRHMTAEARNFLEASATQGNLYAMIRLGNSGSGLCNILGNCPSGFKTQEEWLREAWKISKEQAAQGDPEGLYILFRVTGDFDSLIKSAELGFPFAQYWLAQRYRNGDGFFWLPWRRNQEIERWFKAAAENGHPQAMVEYAVIVYEDRGDMAVVRHWIEEAAKTGYQNGVAHLAGEYAHSPSHFNFPLDLVKAYGLTSLLLVLDGGGGTLRFTERDLVKISAQMTPEQIERGKAFALEWQAAHPRPISFFPMMLDPLDSF
ncbi:tetratricopeptide repeat protein [Pseudomonas alkylphenolica]|uniref:Sel1 domain-containing protein n=1 Tax=Pseudomonas alkylphenolica TaxID=237609 RepID=A0A077F743_9PSED|nr:sel1 repeat family protein [Pseudomonas alkylphenolica]AIL61357.1 Sel1 domain-containing protein [Pseudomonas alkylphenolica]